ncbi:esterase/lipase [Leptodontidium sp. 2 PMI_412]|nr:esterase/lipase [Leptodontidium sp. 2 PMI_412]
MTSNALGSCCYKGVKYEGQLRGRIEALGDTEAYVTNPTAEAANGYGILYLTHIVGYKFTNAQLLADRYTENGYVVIVPDLFYRDSVALNENMVTFSVLTWVQGDYGPKKIPHIPKAKIALAGYSFGAKYAVRFLTSDRIKAGFIGHPAMVEQSELEKVTWPWAITAAEIDYIFPTNLRHSTEETLKKLGIPFQINLYSGVTHGFGVRGDPTVRKERYAKESAFLQALQWFEEHLRDD